jgi:hypothetical protein
VAPQYPCTFVLTSLSNPELFKVEGMGSRCHAVGAFSPRPGHKGSLACCFRNCPPAAIAQTRTNGKKLPIPRHFFCRNQRLPGSGDTSAPGTKDVFCRRTRPKWEGERGVQRYQGGARANCLAPAGVLCSEEFGIV